MNPLSRRDSMKALLGTALLGGLPARAEARPTDRLKITKFVIHKMSLRWRDLLFVEVHTDGGLIGVGEGSLHGQVDIVESALRWLEPHLIGTDPAGVEDHWDRNYYRLTRWRRGPVLRTALSAVDLALWDLEGKRLGVPVWRLLGGPIHRQLRVYYTHWTHAMESRSPEAFARRAAETQAAGWTAVKWSVQKEPGQSDSDFVKSAVANLAAVREAVGDSLDIGIETGEQLWSIRLVLHLANAMAPYRPLFIEEPLPRESPENYGKLAAKSPVTIATGEGLRSRYQFKRLLDANGALIIQPDVLHCGGITELRKIANMAEVYGVEIAPHTNKGPIAHVATLAAMSVCRNFLINEWEAADDALYQELTDGQYRVQKNGKVALPEGPGLGLTFDLADFQKRFPYRPRT